MPVEMPLEFRTFEKLGQAENMTTAEVAPVNAIPGQKQVHWLGAQRRSEGTGRGQWGRGACVSWQVSW